MNQISTKLNHVSNYVSTREASCDSGESPTASYWLLSEVNPTHSCHLFLRSIWWDWSCSSCLKIIWMDSFQTDLQHFRPNSNPWFTPDVHPLRYSSVLKICIWHPAYLFRRALDCWSCAGPEPHRVRSQCKHSLTRMDSSHLHCRIGAELKCRCIRCKLEVTKLNYV